jgi:hypothetical protein
MPVHLKFVTTFTGGEGYGWSEIHYAQSDSDNPNLETQLNNFRSNVCIPRAAMLGEDCSIVGMRVSYPRSGAIASFPRRERIAGTVGRTSSDPSSSLATVFVDSTSTKKKICHLRGWWDEVCYNESFHPESSIGAEWTAQLVVWKTALLAKPYGWLSKDPATSRSGVGVTYAVGGDGRVTFTLPAAGIPDPGGTRNIEIRFSGFNNRSSILNTQVLCEWIDPLHVKSVRVIGASPITNPGKYNYRATTFVGYNQTSSISLGERRMGRPTNRYPGRAKARPLS